jgi:antitoxin VapB
VTEAIVVALRERLARDTRSGQLGEELAAIRGRCASLPVLDSRSGDEILGYDLEAQPD